MGSYKRKKKTGTNNKRKRKWGIIKREKTREYKEKKKTSNQKRRK